MGTWWHALQGPLKHTWWRTFMFRVFTSLSWNRTCESTDVTLQTLKAKCQCIRTYRVLDLLDPTCLMLQESSHIRRTSTSAGSPYSHILFEVQINWPARPIIIAINNYRQDWEWHTMADTCRPKKVATRSPKRRRAGRCHGLPLSKTGGDIRWYQVMSGWFLSDHPKKIILKSPADLWQAHGRHMPGDAWTIWAAGSAFLDTLLGHCLLQGQLLLGCPCGPQHSSCSTNTDIEVLAGMISNQRSSNPLVIDTADGGPTVWMFFFVLQTLDFAIVDFRSRWKEQSSVSDLLGQPWTFVVQDLYLWVFYQYRRFRFKATCKGFIQADAGLFWILWKGHGKSLPPIICGCPVEIRSLHVYLDSSMKLLLFKIYGVEPWEFAFRRCSDSKNHAPLQSSSSRTIPFNLSEYNLSLAWKYVDPAVTKLSMDVFALSWAKGLTSSLLGRNLQRNPTLLELLLRRALCKLQTWYLAQLLSCGSWTSWEAFQICVKHASCTRASEGMFSLMLQRLSALFLGKYASTIAIFK